MKSYFKFILAVLATLAAIAALVGCTKETTTEEAIVVPSSQSSSSEGSRVIAVSFNAQTKTVLDGLRPRFVAEDSILISNGKELDTCEVTVEGDKATISTNLTGPLKAVYPYNAAAIDGNDITGVLVSTVQSGTFADANICKAENITNSATFTSQTAILKIITDAEAEYVEVSTEKADIANNVSGKYTDLKKINVVARAGDTVFVSILPAGLNVCDLSFSDGTITKTFNGNDTPIEINTICTGPLTSDNFYITGGPFGWNMNRTDDRKFSHSGKSILEDPWFTITFPAALSGGTWFAFFDDAAFNGEGEDWYCLFGTSNGDGNSGESGYAARRKNLKDDGVFACSQGCDSIKVEFNALTFEYKVTEISSGTPHFPEYIYEIGNESNWSDSHPLAGLAQDGKYQGYYYLNEGGYKFKPYADNWYWDWEYDGVCDGGLKMADNGGPNFPLPDGGAGVYQINVDLNLMTATLAKVQSISLIGGFNSWNGDVDMTYNTAGGYWEYKNFVLESDDEVKVRMNHDWETNWGGQTSTSFDNLQQGGDNLNIPAGTYHVKFYLSCEGQNHIVFEPVSAPGPASGWNSNIYTVGESGTWNEMEAAGAVFLPTVGFRDGSEISGKKSLGFYWSASYCGSEVGCPVANYLFICSDTVDPKDKDFCKYGYSVRLVTEPSATDALGGVFTVSDSGTPDNASDDIKVRFSKGNLYADASGSNPQFYFENNQYDTTAVKGNRNHLGHFYWSKDPAVSCADSYEDTNSSETDVFFTNDPSNPQSPKEGFTVGGLGGFRTLTADEWEYLLKTRSNANSKVGYATVGGVHGIIILPDEFTDPKNNAGGNDIFVPCQ